MRHRRRRQLKAPLEGEERVLQARRAGAARGRRAAVEAALLLVRLRLRLLLLSSLLGIA